MRVLKSVFAFRGWVVLYLTLNALFFPPVEVLINLSCWYFGVLKHNWTHT